MLLLIVSNDNESLLVLELFLLEKKFPAKDLTGERCWKCQTLPSGEEGDGESFCTLKKMGRDEELFQGAFFSNQLVVF